jgi:hypothetical protein
MSRWTDEELREFVTLWPANSASQIAKRLHRPRSAICRKAEQLRQKGLLPRNLPKHFDVNPPKRRPRHMQTAKQDHAEKATPLLDDMHPCTLLELDDNR